MALEKENQKQRGDKELAKELHELRNQLLVLVDHVGELWHKADPDHIRIEKELEPTMENKDNLFMRNRGADYENVFSFFYTPRSLRHVANPKTPLDPNAIPLEKLGLTLGEQRALEEAGAWLSIDIAQVTRADIASYKGMGPKKIDSLEAKLKKLSLYLASDPAS
jgi:DNA-directed RNA polymerase alpha subunit